MMTEAASEWEAGDDNAHALRARFRLRHTTWSEPGVGRQIQDWEMT